MAASRNSDIKVNRTPIQVVNRLSSVGRRDSALLADGLSRQTFSGVSFLQYHPDFASVVGKDARHALLLSSADSSRNSFFHTGCAHVLEPTAGAGSSSVGVGIPREEEVIYATSNLLQAANSSQLPSILISRVSIQRGAAGDVVAAEWTKLRPPPAMPMPAGAIPYRMPGGSSSGVLYCAQGNPSPGTSGLFYMPRGKPPQPLVTGYYGRDFNSVHDVARHPADGSLWFTDPCLGFEQDFRKKPQMPCHVYRLQPDTGDLRVVADGLRRPTGICFAPDGATVYVTDTDALRGEYGSQDAAARAATIYAYDVLRRGGSDFLASRRVFAYALRGTPTGVRCDAAGNVYAGCADGVEVWSPGGALLGVIEVPDGVTSFCFSREGEMFLCSEQRLWWVHAKPRIEVSRWGASAAAAPMAVDPDDNFI